MSSFYTNNQLLTRIERLETKVHKLESQLKSLYNKKKNKPEPSRKLESGFMMKGG